MCGAATVGVRGCSRTRAGLQPWVGEAAAVGGGSAASKLQAAGRRLPAAGCRLHAVVEVRRAGRGEAQGQPEGRHHRRQRGAAAQAWRVHGARAGEGREDLRRARAAACNTRGCSLQHTGCILQHTGLQPETHTGLQPATHGAAACNTRGCSLGT